MNNPMSKCYDEILGGAYIGNNGSKEKETAFTNARSDASGLHSKKI